MSIHERLVVLRKQLKLTTRAFGGLINMTGAAITNMEKGRREVKERTIKDICREYKVNYTWMTTGDGSMFVDTLSDLNVNDEVLALTKAYSSLDNDDKELVRNLINSLAVKANLNNKP